MYGVWNYFGLVNVNVNVGLEIVCLPFLLQALLLGIFDGIFFVDFLSLLFIVGLFSIRQLLPLKKK